MIAKLFLVFLALTVTSSPVDLNDEALNLLRNRLKNTPFRLDQSMNDFSSKLFEVLTNDNRNGNVLYSPFSLHTALSMTYFGSPASSTTNRELANLLGMDNAYSTDYSTNYLQLLNRYDGLRNSHSATVRFANKIYSDDSFEIKRDFLDLLNIFFRTSQDQVDFSQSSRAVEKINNFVRDKTNNLITNLLSPSDVSALTRMVLVNAIYFKANWKVQFDPADTKSKNFDINERQSKSLPAMTVKGDFGVADFRNYKVLKMPYENEDIAMFILLPDRGVNVNEMSSALKNLDLSKLNNRLTYEVRKVQLPKFKFGVKQSMVSHMERLGVQALFDPFKADLSDISDEPGISVEKVIHEAKIIVNEEGSEAAAATAVSIGTRTISKKGDNFIVDRPFVFVIQDLAFNIPLFVGRVNDPSGSSSQNKRHINDNPLEMDVLPFPAEFVPLEEPEAFESVSAPQEEPPLPLCPTVFGYLLVSSPHISFPCRGRDTRALEAFYRMQRQAKLESHRRRICHDC